jgi:hypothetical protein
MQTIRSAFSLPKTITCCLWNSKSYIFYTFETLVDSYWITYISLYSLLKSFFSLFMEYSFAFDFNTIELNDFFVEANYFSISLTWFCIKANLLYSIGGP